MPRKTYFRMPNYSYPPDSLVLLGQIITSPTQPAARLALPLSPLPTVQRDIKSNCGEIITRSQHGEIGLWAAFLSSLSGIGGDLAATWALENKSAMEFAALETHFFEPDDDFLRKSVDSQSKIREYIKNHPMKSMYMITGIKIARGAKCVSFGRQERGVEAKAGLDATAAMAIPAQGGPKVKVGSSGSEESWFGGSSDFVFAYRLRRIVVTFRGNVKGKNYERRAETLALGDEDDGQEHVDVLHTDEAMLNEEPNEVASIYLDKSDYGTNEVPFPTTSEEVEDELDNGSCNLLIPSI